MLGDALEERAEVVSGEGPVEWFGQIVVAVLESGETPGDLLQVRRSFGLRTLRWRTLRRMMEKTISI